MCNLHVCDYLTNVLSYMSTSSYVKEKSPLKKFFWHIGEIDVTQWVFWECETVKGNRKIAKYDFMGILWNSWFRNLACFFGYCLDDEWEFHVNNAHTRWWRLETLMPLNGTTTCMINNLDDVKVGQNFEFGSDGQSLNATLEVGNNFVALATLYWRRGITLHLLLWKAIVYIRCGVGTIFWDATYFAWEIVVLGKYYKAWHYNKLRPIPFHIPLQWKTQSGVGHFEWNVKVKLVTLPPSGMFLMECAMKFK